MVGALRRAAPCIVALALGALILVTPDLADACPVCNSAKNEASRIAFLVTTAFLSLLPLGLVGGVLYWLRSTVRAAEQSEGQ